MSLSTWAERDDAKHSFIQATIKDSGDRTEFSSGAVRDLHAGKGDMVSLPPAAILRLSKHYENGALKYGRWNYTKGIPVTSFIDSAFRHLFKYLDGWDDEDHLAAAAFNVLGAMEMEAHHKELIDLPSREGKNCFDYTMDIPADFRKLNTTSTSTSTSSYDDYEHNTSGLLEEY